MVLLGPRTGAATAPAQQASHWRKWQTSSVSAPCPRVSHASPCREPGATGGVVALAPPPGHRCGPYRPALRWGLPESPGGRPDDPGRQPTSAQRSTTGRTRAAACGLLWTRPTRSSCLRSRSRSPGAICPSRSSSALVTRRRPPGSSTPSPGPERRGRCRSSACGLLVSPGPSVTRVPKRPRGAFQVAEACAQLIAQAWAG